MLLKKFNIGDDYYVRNTHWYDYKKCKSPFIGAFEINTQTLSRRITYLEFKLLPSKLLGLLYGLE